MAKRKGTVSRVGKGQYSYFIQLDGDGFYFNTKYEPKCGEGDVVGIEFTKKDDKRGQIKNVTILEQNSSGYKASASNSGGGSGGGGGGGDRQDSIVYQSSRKDAIVFVTLLLTNEAFAIKGKPEDMRVQLEELLDEITGRFFKDASDPRKSNALTGDGADDEDDAKESSNDDWEGDNEKSDGKKGEWAGDDEWED